MNCGYTNFEEYIFGTDPTTPDTVLEDLELLTDVGPTLKLATKGGRRYTLQRFSQEQAIWISVITHSATTDGVISLTDPAPIAGADVALYRVKIEIE